MDRKIFAARGFNILQFALIAVWLAVLIFIASAFTMPYVGKEMPVSSVVSSVLLLLVCFPMSISIYRSSEDRVLKDVTLGLAVCLGLLILSGLMLFVLPEVVHDWWVTPAGQITWLSGLASMMISLHFAYLREYKSLNARLRLFLMSTGLFPIAVLGVSLAMYVLTAGVNSFHVAMFTSYAVIDIIVLSCLSGLILINMPNRRRYLLSILFVFFFLNFMGDALSMIEFMGLTESVLFSHTSVYSQAFYDLTFIFLSIALLIYSLLNFTEITVEDVDRRLHDTRRFMDDLIMQSPYSVCIFDTWGQVVRVNDAFVSTFKIDRSRFVGRYNLFRDYVATGLHDPSLLEWLRSGETINIPSAEPRPGLYISVKLFPTYDSEGAVSGYVAISEDVTHRLMLERELKAAYDSLKKEYDNKLNFTNVAAHELRTPLTPIIGYIDMLQMGVRDEPYRSYIEILQRNALRQKKIVDRMLELSRIDAGKIYVHLADVRLHGLIEEVMDNYRSSSRSIFCNVPPDLVVSTDGEMVYQILDNLISNAVKYSSEDTEIIITVAERESDYIVSVRDHGSGIPRTDFDRIFERYYIVDIDRDARNVGRTGLGLSLVKGYVCMLGGEVWLESEQGKGSTFYFTLPKKDDHGAGLGETLSRTGGLTYTS